MTNEPTKKKRLLIFVVAYNAQHTINWVLGRVPPSLTKEFDAEILVIDDQSEDNTFEESEVFAASCNSEFRITVLFRNQISIAQFSCCGLSKSLDVQMHA